MPSFLRAACYATALVAMATALPDGNGDGMRNPIDILPTWSGVSLRCPVLQHLRTRLKLVCQFVSYFRFVGALLGAPPIPFAEPRGGGFKLSHGEQR